jgi:hypothetical protein
MAGILVIAALLMTTEFVVISACETEGLVNVKVNVHSAHVKSKDWISESDPYAWVKLGLQTKHTMANSNTNNPEWNEILEFPCTDVSTQMIVGVSDYDTFGGDDLLMWAEWTDWATAQNGQITKLFNQNREDAKYWVYVSANRTDEEIEPPPGSDSEAPTPAPQQSSAPSAAPTSNPTTLQQPSRANFSPTNTQPVAASPTPNPTSGTTPEVERSGHTASSVGSGIAIALAAACGVCLVLGGGLWWWRQGAPTTLLKSHALSRQVSHTSGIQAGAAPGYSRYRFREQDGGGSGTPRDSGWGVQREMTFVESSAVTPLPATSSPIQAEERGGLYFAASENMHPPPGLCGEGSTGL